MPQGHQVLLVPVPTEQAEWALWVFQEKLVCLAYPVFPVQLEQMVPQDLKDLQEQLEI